MQSIIALCTLKMLNICFLLQFQTLSCSVGQVAWDYCSRKWKEEIKFSVNSAPSVLLIFMAQYSEWSKIPWLAELSRFCNQQWHRSAIYCLERNPIYMLWYLVTRLLASEYLIIVSLFQAPFLLKITCKRFGLVCLEVNLYKAFTYSWIISLSH